MGVSHRHLNCTMPHQLRNSPNYGQLLRANLESIAASTLRIVLMWSGGAVDLHFSQLGKERTRCQPLITRRGAGGGSGRRATGTSDSAANPDSDTVRLLPRRRFRNLHYGRRDSIRNAPDRIVVAKEAVHESLIYDGHIRSCLEYRHDRTRGPSPPESVGKDQIRFPYKAPRSIDSSACRLARSRAIVAIAKVFPSRRKSMEQLCSSRDPSMCISSHCSAWPT